VDDPRSVQPSDSPNSGQISPGLGPDSQQSTVPDPALHFEDERDTLLIKLLFAARRLASRSISRYGFTGTICGECGQTGIADLGIAHSPACNAGLIESLLERIAALYERKVDQAAAGAPGEFCEPWYVDPCDPRNVRNADGLIILDAFGSELFGDDETRIAARIAACVNACVGVSTEALLRNAQPKEELHGVDSLFGCKAPEPPAGLGISADFATFLDGDDVQPFQYPDAGGQI
jgi:hypothetical protein